MAVPLTADQLVRALKNEGVKVVEVPGWRTNNRAGHGAWGPVHGIVDHHTVTGPKVNAVPICFNGLADLPGPLCHGVIRRDGSVHLVGNGRANHAGGGDPDVLAAVTDESYSTRPPATDKHQGEPGAVDGNAHFYGFECENLGDGKDPWPPAQVEAMVRANAAICRAHGWSAKSAIGHLEWSDWKSDPRGPGFPGMPALRSRIDQRLAHTANWTPGSTTTPAPTPPASSTGAARMYTSLSLTTPRPVLAGQAYRIYWDTENADQPGDHGTGGKTFLDGLNYYTGTASLVFAAPVPAGVTVRFVREGATDDRVEPASDIPAGVDHFNHPGTGVVDIGRSLVVEVTNGTVGTITIDTGSAVRVQSWAS